MARVFVSGAAGFLGSHLCERLEADGHEVYGADNLLGGDIANVPGKVGFFKMDCCDLDDVQALLRRFRPDVVYHLAAAPHEGLSVFSPCVVTRNTYLSTVAVVTAAITAGVRRFVFTSSMARYGKGTIREIGPQWEETFCAFSEEEIPAAVDPYGVAKVAAEQALRVLAEAHGMEWVVIVPHNIIGPRQKYDDPFRNVASIFINLMLQCRQPIIYGDGLQRRAFSYVGDCIKPLVKAGFQKGLGGEVINIGPDNNAVSILDLAKLIATLLNFDLHPYHHAARPCEVKEAWPSADKARRLLGYETNTSLIDGLHAMIDWIRTKGPKPFVYHLPIEIQSGGLPRTWKDQLF